MRVVILADVHLGFPDTQIPGQNYTYAADLLERAVSRIQQSRPDRVILLGDMVNMGTAEEYARSAEILAPLRDILEPVIGNHELIRGSIAEWSEYWGAPVRRLPLGSFPAIVLNSAMEGLPLTQWGGRIDLGQLMFLEDALAASDRPALVFSHHPLANSVRRSDQPMFGLDNSSDVSAILDAHRHDIILFSGHTHYQSVIRRGRVNCIGCPPICFWPHALLTLDIDGASVRYSSMRLFEDIAQSPDIHATDPEYRRLGEGQMEDRAGIIHVQ